MSFKTRLDEHALIIGDTQTGKTTSAAALAQEQNKHGYISIVVNTKNDRMFYDIPPFGKGVAKYINTSIDQFIYYLNDYRTDGIIEIRPQLIKGKTPIAQIEPYLEELINFKKTDQEFPTAIFVDELHRLQSKMSISTMLQNLWTMGKGLNLFACGMSQRNSHISNDIWTQSEIYFLHKTKPRDLKFMYDQRYLAIPQTWLIPLNNPESEYPWKTPKDIHKLFFQAPYTNGLVELPFKNKPPF